jgi:hypothetical protein
VIEALALAIGDHRAGWRSDEQLYLVLEESDLDTAGLSAFAGRA